MKEFTPDETNSLFEYVCSNGVALGADLKPNWNDLRDNFYRKNTNFDQKVVSLVERLVQNFRMVTLKILQNKMATEA